MTASPIKDSSQYKKHIDLVWTIANLLRGPHRPPQYRRVMIPLTVLRRLDCVLEDSKAQVMKRYTALKAADKNDGHAIKWAFLTGHRHSSGEDVQVGHVGCNLYVEEKG